MRAVLQKAVDERSSQWEADLQAGAQPSYQNPTDLLDMILPHRAKSGTSLTADDLLPNLWLFFLAGHDTTAISLAWTLHLLARYPEVQEKARQEALRLVGESGVPAAHHLSEASYISMVINESLRLYPPVHTIPTRYSCADTELDGYLIPKGSMISLGISAICRHPDTWTNPDLFNPDRFKSKHSGFDFLPFSAGKRRCLGDKFSLMEQKTFLIMLLTQFRVKPYTTQQPNNHQTNERIGHTDFSGDSVPLTFTQPERVDITVERLH